MQTKLGKVLLLSGHVLLRSPKMVVLVKGGEKRQVGVN